ncbi:MAG: ribosome silencing factor [Desulfatitalea sp.]|nr:ribosome silencing factor [Desulfatitalea sp.]NNK01451.1 ribosome silencing factor [Desulfatitalea sp.]
MTNQDQIDAQVDLYVQAALGKKAENLVVLDVRGLTSIADVFIICHGRSNRQVEAIADHIQHFLRDRSIKPLSIEGKNDGHWVLMDYGHVVIHVFYEETRAFYDLEGLWVDARRICSDNIQRQRDADACAFNGEEVIVD